MPNDPVPPSRSPADGPSGPDRQGSRRLQERVTILLREIDELGEDRASEPVVEGDDAGA